MSGNRIQMKRVAIALAVAAAVMPLKAMLMNQVASSVDAPTVASAIAHLDGPRRSSDRICRWRR